jgi:hypothetical protein
VGLLVAVEVVVGAMVGLVDGLGLAVVEEIGSLVVSCGPMGLFGVGEQAAAAATQPKTIIQALVRIFSGCMQVLYIKAGETQACDI